MLFSHGRIALKYGILSLNFSQEDEILIPDFICSEVTSTLDEIFIKYRFYKIRSDLRPNLNSLQRSIRQNTKAILVVNYFGFPQEFNKLSLLCKKEDLILFEDNAHGFGSEFNKRKLGSFGDISISSPRKNLNLNSGGELLSNFEITEDIALEIKNLPHYKFSKIENLFHELKNLNYSLKASLRFLFKKQQNFKSIQAPSCSLHDMKIDKISKKKLSSCDLRKIRKKRRSIYKVWEKFALKNGLNPVFNEIQEGIIPLCFPAFANDISERNIWIKWGWENRYNIYCWPNLPGVFKDENCNANIIWQKLLCFPIDNSMNVNSLEKKLSKL